MLKQMIVSWSWSGALHRHLCDLTPIDMVLHPFRPCNALDFYIQCIYTQTHKSETPITMVSNPFGPCSVLQCKMHSAHVPYKHIYNKIQSNRATQPKKAVPLTSPLKAVKQWRLLRWRHSFKMLLLLFHQFTILKDDKEENQWKTFHMEESLRFLR